MTRSIARDLWVSAFLFILFAPFVLRIVAPEHQTFWRELITVTGLLVLSLLVCALVLPARLRSLTSTFGIEAVLANHRVLAVSAAVGALAHVAAVLAADPGSVALLVPLLAPLRATAGLLALVCLVWLVLSAARRRARYEVWRGMHLVLTLGVIGGSTAHIVLIGHLIWDRVAAGYLVVLAAVVVAVEVHRWLVRPRNPQSRYRVVRTRELSPTVSTLVVRPVADAPALVFRPGQFVWLRLHRGPLTEEHPFTISSAAPSRRRAIEFTIRHVGDWTDGPLRQLRPGDPVWLDGPHGALTPDGSADGLVLVAGGVGIAPMMSILRTAAQDGDHRAIRLLLADRPGEALYRDELRWLQHDLELTICELRQATLTAERFAALLPASSQRDRLDYLVCGPPSLVGDALDALDRLDVPATRVHTERFDS